VGPKSMSGTEGNEWDQKQWVGTESNETFHSNENFWKITDSKIGLC